MPPPRRRTPAVDPLPRDRSRGALLGLAVGDAGGAPFQGRLLAGPSFPELARGPHAPFEGLLGHPERAFTTDDTQMACCLAASLKELGRFDAENVAERYLAWQRHGTGLGELTRKTLEDMREVKPLTGAARRVWARGGKKDAGNGSLMRTAPLGVFFAKDRKACATASLEDSALTHYDPRCQLACAALNASIAAAIHGGVNLKKEALLEAASSGLTLASALLGRMASEHVKEVVSAGEALREDLALAQQDDPRLYGPELHLHAHAGFVRTSFRLAYWELLHAPSWEAALTDLVNRGGDTDTHGAITGALLGSFYGESAIPEPWRTAVLGAMSDKPSGPLWALYHPRLLLGLVAD